MTGMIRITDDRVTEPPRVRQPHRPNRWAASIVVLVAGAIGATGLASSASAQTTSAPGYLQTTDLPDGYQLRPGVGAPTPFVVAQVDRKACTQTSKPVAGQTGASLVAFSPPGAPTTTSGLLEYVLTFPTAKAATTAYKALAGDAAARLKCKTVDYIPADKTAPTVPSTYAKVKVPKVGEGTVATSGSTSTTKGSILVTFVDGTHVVGLSFAGEPYAPNANDLATITKNADTRLAELG